MQSDDISFMLPYKQSDRWQDVLDTQYQVHQVQVPSTSCHRPDCLILSIKYIKYKYQAHLAIDQTAYTDAWKKCHKTACTSLPEDGHLDVRNMSKIL